MLKIKSPEMRKERNNRKPGGRHHGEEIKTNIIRSLLSGFLLASTHAEPRARISLAGIMGGSNHEASTHPFALESAHLSPGRSMRMRDREMNDARIARGGTHHGPDQTNLSPKMLR